MSQIQDLITLKQKIEKKLETYRENGVGENTIKVTKIKRDQSEGSN